MSKSDLTERQRQLLTIIYTFIKNTGFPPSFEEMKKALDVVSNQSVMDLLTKLEKQKLIKRNEAQARGIVILPLGYEVLDKPQAAPFLGITHAGASISPIEMEGEWQQLPGGLAKLTDEVFVLRVSGDSMINAGIDDGDNVLIKNQREFSSGDIVLAEVDGESTIKRFISDDKPPYLYLKPENPKYDLILFTNTVELKGKVMYVFSKGQVKPIN